jgi:hypothetical protein
MEVRHSGKKVKPEISEWNGKTRVIATTPMSNKRSIKMTVLENNPIPEGKEGYLHFSAGHKKNQKWKLRVRKGGEYVIDTVVSAANSKNGWMDFTIDVSEFASQENINLMMLVENMNEQPAINYWADFRLERLNKVRSD